MKNPKQKFSDQIAEVQRRFDNGLLTRDEGIEILKIRESEMKSSINAIQQRKKAFNAKVIKKRALKAIQRKKQKVTRVIENSIGTVKQMSTTVFPHADYAIKSIKTKKIESTINLSKVWEREDGRGFLRASL